jgi:hypothetical protein
VPKKNGKLRICVDFKKLDVVIKKDPNDNNKLSNVAPWFDQLTHQQS